MNRRFIYVQLVVDMRTMRVKVGRILERFLDFENELVLIVHVLDSALALDNREILTSSCNKGLEARRIGFVLVSGEVFLHTAFDVLAEVVVLPSASSLEKISVQTEDDVTRYRSGHDEGRNETIKIGHVRPSKKLARNLKFQGQSWPNLILALSLSSALAKLSQSTLCTFMRLFYNEFICFTATLQSFTAPECHSCLENFLC